VSWLIAQGVQLPAISRRLGHESITTTIDRYGDLLREVDDGLVKGLARDGIVLLLAVIRPITPWLCRRRAGGRPTKQPSDGSPHRDQSSRLTARERAVLDLLREAE
jgi:hypothetical protein